MHGKGQFITPFPLLPADPFLLSVLKDATGAFSANLRHLIFRILWESMPPDPKRPLARCAARIFLAI